MDSLQFLRRFLASYWVSPKVPECTFSRFFDLPAEIRYMIYQKLWFSKTLKYDSSLWILRQDGTNNYSRDVETLVVCKQWYMEALPVLLHTTIVRPTDAVVKYYGERSKSAVPLGIPKVIHMLPAVKHAALSVGELTIGNVELMLDAMQALRTLDLTYSRRKDWLTHHGLNICWVHMNSARSSTGLPDLMGINHIRTHADDLVLQKKGNYHSSRLSAIVKAWLRRRKPFSLNLLCCITCYFAGTPWAAVQQAAGPLVRRYAYWKTRTNYNSKEMDFLDDNGNIKMKIPLYGLPV
ncbi:uncharacterized protein AB675_4104 [Cyphellophora attinorum]|uniref:F-box domain-containing protein n=1 Tax=Cyphellophora attinorum TaxID=1664694 RepID=A0A0N1NZB8_9EURO|nr:uncharacterized protein AB675_4104 [Phialophora attinorum]KPI38507.1 hypothetical protein AB675_4104 [Phialophora attinorum]